MSDRTNSQANLLGTRATFVMNVCALVLASVITVEAIYIQHADLGYVVPGDILLCFFPVIVMFVIRSEPFSFFYLLAHLGISIGLFSAALGVFAGTVKLSKAHNPLFLLVLFTMLTIVCVAVYVLVALIKLIFSNLSSERARRRADSPNT